MYRVVEVGVITLLEWVLVILFVFNFSWIAVAFTSSVVGFLWLLFRAPAPGPLPDALTRKTAVVMPIYNEAPARVFAAVQAICEDVRATGLGDAFDYFFLSDTTDPDIWVAEERALLAMRERLPASASTTGTGARTPRARRAISGISSPAGAPPTTTWSCSTPTA